MMPELDQNVIFLSDGQTQLSDAADAHVPPDLINALLDDDTLGELFLYFPAQAHWKEEYGHEDSTWLSITHVCRRWRNLSVSTPSIWSNIITSPPFWTPLCLERSQSAPIDIKLQ